MHVVIVEDEPLIQQRIKRLTLEILAQQQPRIDCFADIDDARAFLAEHTLDVLLLDLNLMGRDGFDLLKDNVAAAYHTIVISAYADQAIRAFEYGVLDFVAKPFTIERLSKAFDRLLQNSQRSHYGCRYLSVRKLGMIELIAVAEITHIQADGHYTLLYLQQPQAGTLTTAHHDKNIEKLSQVLPPSFMRVHRSYVVNMAFVTKLKIAEGSSYALVLRNDAEIPVGRTRIDAVKRYLTGNGLPDS